MHYCAAVASLILSVKIATCVPTGPLSSTKPSINWFDCPQNSTDPLALEYICGTLVVPLDYTPNSSNQTLTLDLVKISAAKQPKKGTIIENTGGPEAVRSQLTGFLGDAIFVAAGGSYDVVTFDPRGTGNTIPFDCLPNPGERAVYTQELKYLNASDTAIGSTWAAQQQFALACATNAYSIGELMSTAFIARDMLQIVDALGEDGLLRYWGFSYGTMLGATFAAMFPDRVDKMVLDGNLDAPTYRDGDDTTWLGDTDATFEGFCRECIADPTNCSLAAEAETADELSDKIYRLIESLKYDPAVSSLNYTIPQVTYTSLKGIILNTLYSPSLWPTLASGISALLAGQVDEAFATLAPLAAGGVPTFPDNGPDAIAGIRCGDVTLRTKDHKDLDPIIAEAASLSRLGGDVELQTLLACAQWPFRSKEVYEGDFKAATKNPILLIGNTYDPVTPIANTRKMSAAFKDSVVLEQNGYGHTSTAQPSLCTANIVREYFECGILPPPGTVCQVDTKPFANETLPAAFARVYAPISDFGS